MEENNCQTLPDVFYLGSADSSLIPRYVKHIFRHNDFEYLRNDWRNVIFSDDVLAPVDVVFA